MREGSRETDKYGEAEREAERQRERVRERERQRERERERERERKRERERESCGRLHKKEKKSILALSKSSMSREQVCVNGRTFTNESHSGISSSQLSMMKTLRTYSLMLLCFFLLAPSNMSKGALFGINITARNSSWPWGIEKWGE